MWEARWRPAVDGPPGDFQIQIRLIEAAGRSSTVTTLSPAYTETSPDGGAAGADAA